MPDHFDLEEIRRRQAEARTQAFQELDTPYEPTPAERALAIVDCGLCDDDGYRGARVCDHREYASAETREAAKARLREALAKDGKR